MDYEAEQQVSHEEKSPSQEVDEVPESEYAIYSYDEISSDFNELRFHFPVKSRKGNRTVRITDARNRPIRIQGCAFKEGTDEAFRNGSERYRGDPLFIAPFGISLPYHHNPSDSIPNKLALDFNIHSEPFVRFLLRLEQHIKEVALDQVKNWFNRDMTAATIELLFSSCIEQSADYKPKVRTHCFIRPTKQGNGTIRPPLDVFVREPEKEGNNYVWRNRYYQGELISNDKNPFRGSKSIPTFEIGYIQFTPKEFKLQLFTVQAVVVEEMPPDLYMETHSKDLSLSLVGSDRRKRRIPLDNPIMSLKTQKIDDEQRERMTNEPTPYHNELLSDQLDRLPDIV